MGERVPVDFASIDAYDGGIGVGSTEGVEEGFSHEVGAAQNEDSLILFDYLHINIMRIVIRYSSIRGSTQGPSWWVRSPSPWEGS